MILWFELKEGTKVEILQDIFTLNTSLITETEDYDVIITGNQLKNGFVQIAAVGTIATWNGNSLELPINNSDKVNEIPFYEGDDPMVDEEIFKILER